MKRMSTMIGVALVLSVSVAAQTATTTQSKTDKDKEMTITGCLEKNKSGGFWLTHAVDSIASTTTGASSTTTSSGSTTTGTTGTATTTGASKTAGLTFNLEGGNDLDKHVGHKISVTGHAKGDVSGDELKGTTGPEVKARDFDVKSIKMIAASCS
jgi:hypothetical protein